MNKEDLDNNQQLFQSILEMCLNVRVHLNEMQTETFNLFDLLFNPLHRCHGFMHHTFPALVFIEQSYMNDWALLFSLPLITLSHDAAVRTVSLSVTSFCRFLLPWWSKSWCRVFGQAITYSLLAGFYSMTWFYCWATVCCVVFGVTNWCVPMKQKPSNLLLKWYVCVHDSWWLLFRFSSFRVI